MDRKPTKNYQIHYSRLAAALAVLFVVVVIIVFIAAGGLKKESTDDGSTSADASDSSGMDHPAHASFHGTLQQYDPGYLETAACAPRARAYEHQKYKQGA